METVSETSQTKELKPWQKGFELDYLKDLEKRFKVITNMLNTNYLNLKRII